MRRHASFWSLWPFAALDAAMLRNVTAKLHALERSQWLGEEAFEELRTARIKALLEHAHAACPYYRALFRQEDLQPKDIRRAEDLARLPILTREILRERIDELCSDRVPERQWIRSATGGSTGTPTPIFYTRKALSWRTAASNRLYRMAGRFTFTRTLNLAGSPIDARRHEELPERLKSLVRREKRLHAFDLSLEDYARLLDDARRFRPEFLMGYCAALRQLARTALVTGADLRIPRVMPLAETVSAEDRKLFREAFRAETFELYGSREVTAIAGECEAHEGLHVSADLVHLEIVRNGDPVPIGEEGEIVLTDLANFGMPLIRYAIGDVGRLLPRRCSCGRTLPLMEITRGRVLDRILLPGGRVLPSAYLPHLFKEVWRAVREYQVLQTATDRVEVRIVPTDRWNEGTRDYLLRRLEAKLGPETRVSIQLREFIPRETSGKFRPVKSLVASQTW